MKKPEFWLGLGASAIGVYVVFREWSWLNRSEVSTVIFALGLGLVLLGVGQFLKGLRA